MQFSGLDRDSRFCLSTYLLPYMLPISRSWLHYRCTLFTFVTLKWKVEEKNTKEAWKECKKSRQNAKRVICSAKAGLSSQVVSTSDCSVRGSRFESHHGQLCLSRKLLRYTVLSTGCAPLPQCLGRLSLPPFVGW